MAASFLADISALPRRPEVTVIGGGIAGLATTFFLSRHGIRPLLVERLPALSMLASRRSGEGVRAQWEKRENIDIARASIAFYRDFAEVTGVSAGYRPLGYLYGARSAAGAARLRARVERQKAAGLDDVRYLTPSEMHALTPTLAEDVTGGAVRQADGVIEVDRVIEGYLKMMQADILVAADLQAIIPGPGGITLTINGETLETGHAILCTAARLPAQLQALGIALPLRLARSTIQYLQLDAVPPDHPAMVDADLGSFWRPHAGGARMTASFRSTLFLDRFTDDPEIAPDYLRSAIDSVAPLVPFWRAHQHEIRGGHLRSGSLLVTGDGGPLIGALPGQPRLWVNSGYGGHGLMASPEGARRLAAMVAGAAPDIPFAPERFLNGTPIVPEPMTVNLASAP